MIRSLVSIIFWSSILVFAVSGLTSCAEDRRYDVHLFTAIESIELGEFDLAVNECTTAIQLAPERYPAYFWRATAYLRKHDTQKAVPDLRRADELFAPDSSDHGVLRSDLFVQFGHYWRQVGDIEKSEQSFQTVLAQNPLCHGSRVGMIVLKARTGSSAEAVQYCQSLEAEAWESSKCVALCGRALIAALGRDLGGARAAAVELQNCGQFDYFQRGALERAMFAILDEDLELAAVEFESCLEAER